LRFYLSNFNRKTTTAKKKKQQTRGKICLMSENELRVFVYGTLKPNGQYYPLYCQGKTSKEQKGWTRGKLFALSVGYPAMIEGNDQVYGFLLTFTCLGELDNLDQLEGYVKGRNPSENEYQRKQVIVYDELNQPLNNAWAYFMTLEKVKSLAGVYLPSGWW
jgi:gamma-glutamylcyclotransferase (GGCT)/AIG2-like uncharacterized protein YtfP